MILIALGANLPDSSGRSALETCRATAQALGRLPGLRLVSLSRWWRSAPLPASEQPDYINGVARLSGEIAPEALLLHLQALEDAAGRRRGPERNGPRPLDLDILAMDGLVRKRPDPIVPHPRMHLRRFVLAPLAEVAPEWVHPLLGLSVSRLLAALPAQRLSPLGRSDSACERKATDLSSLRHSSTS